MKHVDDRALVRLQLVFVGFVFLVNSSAALRTFFFIEITAIWVPIP